MRTVWDAPALPGTASGDGVGGKARLLNLSEEVGVQGLLDVVVAILTQEFVRVAREKPEAFATRVRTESLP